MYETGEEVTTHDMDTSMFEMTVGTAQNKGEYELTGSTYDVFSVHEYATLGPNEETVIKQVLV